MSEITQKKRFTSRRQNDTSSSMDLETLKRFDPEKKKRVVRRVFVRMDSELDEAVDRVAKKRKISKNKAMIKAACLLVEDDLKSETKKK